MKTHDIISYLREHNPHKSMQAFLLENLINFQLWIMAQLNLGKNVHLRFIPE